MMGSWERSHCKLCRIKHLLLMDWRCPLLPKRDSTCWRKWSRLHLQLLLPKLKVKPGKTLKIKNFETGYFFPLCIWQCTCRWPMTTLSNAILTSDLAVQSQASSKRSCSSWTLQQHQFVGSGLHSWAPKCWWKGIPHWSLHQYCSGMLLPFLVIVVLQARVLPSTHWLPNLIHA